MEKKKIKNNSNKRLKLLSIFLIISFLIIITRLVFINIYLSKHYKILEKNKTSNIVYGSSSPRGRIYDRNMNLLVDNISVKSIYYSKPTSISTEKEIEIAYLASKHINLDYKDLTERNLKEFFLVTHSEESNNKITDQEYKDLENRKLTENDIYNLKIERITNEDLSVFKEEDKKCAYLYYLMNKGYSYEEKLIKENVTDEEYAYFGENTNELKGFNTKLTWKRVYLYKNTLKSILGSINEIPKEEKDYYLEKGYTLSDTVGVSGIEKQYEEILKGEKDEYKVTENNELKLYKKGKKGNDIVLSIDINLQQDIENILKEELRTTKNEANTEFYNRSFVVITNPKTGEIISLAGKQILYDDTKKDYEYYDFDEGTIISTVTPGSVVKGASITVGYNTKVIDIGTVMYDSCIKFLNMPEKCSWSNLGTINDLDALKWSSNVYQYKIAMLVGGFDYAYNKELKVDLKAFDTYRKTFYQYGLGSSTGIDYPKEDTGYKGGSYAGDLLVNYAIGQYDTYTPIQLAQYVSTIANDGNRQKLHFLKSILNEEKEVIYEYKPITLNKVKTEDKYIKRIQQGFHLVMQGGTGVNFISNKYDPAGKTGTSESFVDIDEDGVVDNETISNNFVGYAPFNNPTMAISVSSPDVQNPNRGEYKSDVNYRISKRSSEAYFNHYNLDGSKKS